jgi:hypothetical protein
LGSPDEGAEVVRPLKQFGRAIGDLLEPKPYTALQSMFDPFVPHGWHRYWKSVELPPLTDDAIDTLVEQSSAPTSPKSYTIVFQLGGALGRVGEDETAFGQRDAAHNVNINAVWTEEYPDAERHIAWARDFFDAMQPHAGGRVYLNFLGEEGDNRGARPMARETTSGWSSSSAPTTRPTSSGSTRTSSPERPRACTHSRLDRPIGCSLPDEREHAEAIILAIAAFGPIHIPMRSPRVELAGLEPRDLLGAISRRQAESRAI